MNLYKDENDVTWCYILDIHEETGHSIQGLRYLTQNGNVLRKMASQRDRGRIMIPLVELKGYPFVRRGAALGSQEIYHYVLKDGKWERVICKQCSYSTEHCKERIEADALYERLTNEEKSEDTTR